MYLTNEGMKIGGLRAAALSHFGSNAVVSLVLSIVVYHGSQG